MSTADAGSHDAATDATANHDVDMIDDAEDGDPCPIATEDRSTVAQLTIDSLMDGVFIVGQSHGEGMFADRAFGGKLLLTSAGAIFFATITEACTEPEEFAETCDPRDPKAGESQVIRCSQLECEAAGIMTATTTLDSLPITRLREPPPGSVIVHRFDSLVRFDETPEDGSLAIEWTNDVGVEPEGAGRIDVHASGTGRSPSDEKYPASLSLSVEIEGVAENAIALAAESTDDGEITGEGSIDDERIFTVHTTGSELPELVWVDACASSP